MDNIKEIYLKGQERLKKTDFFTTGFLDLDIFCKYLEGGNVLTIGGRPAMGKTSFALSLLNHILDRKKNVLFFTMDSPKEKVVNKLVAEKIGTPLFSLIEGKVREEEVNIILESFNDNNLEIVDKTDLSIDDAENYIKEYKPDIVFINYIQLLKMPKAPNLTEATNLAIKEVKRIAVENNVIVVLLSQLSRAVEARTDKHPLLSDLRNGSLLEEVSDVILFIYREEYYNNETEFPDNEIIVAKNTVGPVGKICLDFKNGFFKGISL